MKSFREIIEESNITEAKLTKKELNSIKDNIRMYQAKQYRAGNKISWEEATDFVSKDLIAAKKAAKKLKAPKAPRVPKEKLMTDAQFNKMMKAVRSDMISDFPETDIENIAWDVAGSLIHNQDVEKYVRAKMAKNSGRDPKDISRNMVIEFIADSIA